jgi:hypothetical protein
VGIFLKEGRSSYIQTSNHHIFNTVHYLCRWINLWSSTLYSLLHPVTSLLIEIFCSAPLSNILNLFSLAARDQDLHAQNVQNWTFCVNFNLLVIIDIGVGLDIVKTRKISCPCQDMNSHFLRRTAYSIVTIPTELSSAPLQTSMITFFWG